MSNKQAAFLKSFQKAFCQQFNHNCSWKSGQTHTNTAALLMPHPKRRSIGIKSTECFELGDISTTFSNWDIIVEFENNEILISNILKFWPYICGELSSVPSHSLILCHFSDWASYATRRDLWDWTLQRMQADPTKKVDILGFQFDHGGSDMSLRARSIQKALLWINEITHGEP